MVFDKFDGDTLLQVRLPYVAAHELQSCGSLRAQHAEEAQQRLDGAILADPQQPAAGGVNLVDDGEVAVPFLELDFVHADGGNSLQAAVLKAVFHHPGHAAEHVVPGGSKDQGHFPPT